MILTVIKMNYERTAWKQIKKKNKHGKKYIFLNITNTAWKKYKTTTGKAN